MTGDDSIWASLPVPALLIGADDCIADVNAAAEGFLNASRRSVTGRPLWDVIAVDAAVGRAFADARRNNAPLLVNDVEIGTGGREAVECGLQIAPLAGRPGGMLMLIVPRQLAGPLTQGHSARSAAQSAIGMARMLAHEIKNPLAGIIGAAQLLGMNLGPQDIELTDLVVAESRRIVKLLEQVDEFGNLRPPELQPINLHDLLDRARRSALLGFGAHMRIVEAYDPSLPLAWGDPDQLLQVFLNLLKNASEAADKKGGTIRLRSYFEHRFRLRRSDRAGHSLPLQVEVIDDGPGLPEAIRDAVFDPFVSGRENGTGLGLALVSKIVSDHGGWISVASVPGRTVFRLSLPRVPADAAGNRLEKGTG